MEFDFSSLSVNIEFHISVRKQKFSGTRRRFLHWRILMLKDIEKSADGDDGGGDADGGGPCDPSL